MTKWTLGLIAIALWTLPISNCLAQMKPPTLNIPRHSAKVHSEDSPYRHGALPRRAKKKPSTHPPQNHQAQTPPATAN